MIIHPFMPDTANLSMDELADKISKISKQIHVAQNMGRYDMIRQMQMVQEGYRSEYTRRQQEQWDKRNIDVANKVTVNSKTT